MNNLTNKFKHLVFRPFSLDIAHPRHENEQGCQQSTVNHEMVDEMVG
jgi:hypothetical protein